MTTTTLAEPGTASFTTLASILQPLNNSATTLGESSDPLNNSTTTISNILEQLNSSTTTLGDILNLDNDSTIFPPGVTTLGDHHKSVQESWEEHKAELGWLIPVIILITIFLALAALGLFYVIRSAELWCIKCCYRHCACCQPKDRKLDSEYSHLTEGMHDPGTVSMTEIDKTSMRSEPATYTEGEGLGESGLSY